MMNCWPLILRQGKQASIVVSAAGGARGQAGAAALVGMAEHERRRWRAEGRKQRTYWPGVLTTTSPWRLSAMKLAFCSAVKGGMPASPAVTIGGTMPWGWSQRLVRGKCGVLAIEWIS